MEFSEMTYNERYEMTNTKQILRLFDNVRQLRIMVKIECQTFLYYYVYLLWDVEFEGSVANYFDTSKLTFAKQKSTIWIKLDIKMKFWHR